MHETVSPIRTAAAVMTAAVLAATSARSTSTQIWQVGTQEEFAEGTFDGTQVDSTGQVTMGISTLETELAQTAVVWSSVRMDQEVYLGTGNRGALWLLKGKRLVELTRTASVVVTALATDGRGTLFAGTIPGGSILRFDDEELEDLAGEALAGVPQAEWKPAHTPADEKKEKKEKGTKKKDAEKKKDTKKKDEKDEKDEKEPITEGPGHWVKLEDAEHVWALVYDRDEETLYAGTGPEGIVYAVDRSGRATVLADTDEQHIMTLALADDGSLLAGTANGARVLRIEGPGRVDTLWDFDATEVKSLALVDVAGEQEPAVVAAVNKFKKPASFPVKMPSKKDLTEPGRTGKAGSIKIPDGSGLIAALLPGGGYRELLEEKKTHFTSMEASDGGVVAATGAAGRLVEVMLDGRYTLVLDVSERQVLTFDLEPGGGFLGTADPAAVHRVQSKPPSEPRYVSRVFDAKFNARWGRMVLRGDGRIVWQTRSGNTSKPDDTWSDWTKPSSALEGQVGSPPARFLQYRLEVGPSTQVWNTQVFYLPHNQQALLTEVAVGGDEKKKKKSKKSGSGAPEPEREIEIEWEVDNPDDDELVYELWFAEEGSDQWIAMLDPGQTLDETEFEWDTTAVPSGYYVVKVRASDAEVNDPSLALTHELSSRSFLVDNDPPEVDLKVAAGKGRATFSGVVEDDFSAISRIELSLDGGPFVTLFPSDLILDETRESFEHVEKDLEAGPHTATLRGFDQRGNSTSAGAHFTVK